MGTGRTSFAILLPEPLKIFELNVYFDNQIICFYEASLSSYIALNKNKNVTLSRVKR